jgi:hypothetical protein
VLGTKRRTAQTNSSTRIGQRDITLAYSGQAKMTAHDSQSLIGQHRRG